MRSIRIAAIVATALLALVSCNRDPNVAKQRYLESGNKYFEKGLYRQARIKYMNALQKDMKFGPAYYGRGMTEYKTGQLVPAVLAFRRAIELLLPKDNPQRLDAMVKAADILLLAGQGKKEFMDEAKVYWDEILTKRDPNSFDGHRLKADWYLTSAIGSFKTAQKDEGITQLETAIAEYRKADAIKPRQVAVELQLARAIQAKGDFAGAEQLFRQVIAQDKSLQIPYSDLYRLLLYQRKVAEAEQLLKDAIQNNPKQFGYLTTLALHYSLQRRTPEMLNVLQQIKSHANEFPEAYLVVGEFYLRLGEGDTAIKEFKAGQAKDPKRKLDYEKRIIEVLMRQNKRSEAADRNAAILKTNPNDNDAKGLAATFLLDKGDINRAIVELQAVVTSAPDNFVARFNLGRAHMAQGQLEQARQMFQKVIELKADYLPARLALAQLQVSHGEYEAGLKTADEILALDRGNVNAMLIESAALILQKKLPESRGRLNAMAKAYPNLPDVYFQLGVVDLAESKFKDAEGSFRKSYDLNPANPRGLIGIVETDMAQNKSEDALALLQAEADKAPNRLEIRVALAQTATSVGKFDVAVGEYQKVLDALDKTSSRERGQIYWQMGEVYRRKGDDVSAIAALQKAREILPEDGRVMTTLALTFDHAGRTPEAKQIYEAALKLEPGNGVALNNLAFLLAEHNGDLDDALTKGTRAKQLMPNLAEVSDTLGWIYLKKNLSDDAVKIFQDLVAKSPNQSTYRYHLAMALKQKGDKSRAIKECQEALKNNPSKEERLKIQDLLTRLNGA
jgi:tetratricopeptide (TPR) repeat protein